jgi:thiosulfate/3-mercaptopyruvate sulfurtransferase
MTYVNSHALVTTQWLSEHLDDPSLRIIDASWHMPALQRNASAEFVATHIPRAAFFDIDDIADETIALPHMIPSAAKFSQRLGKLGIANDHQVIVYDATGIGSAPRAWWMLRLFGHNNVAVLDGGLPKWLAEKRPTESGAGAPQAQSYDAQRDDSLVRTLEQMLRNVDEASEQVLDARSAGRFDATEPEPRQSLRGGHIPGSFNRPFVNLYDAEAKTMKSAAELVALFDESGVVRDRPIVTSCGSGVTACNLALGLYLIGASDVAIYDGSWTEWGGRDDTPIEP